MEVWFGDCWAFIALPLPLHSGCLKRLLACRAERAAPDDEVSEREEEGGQREQRGQTQASAMQARHGPEKARGATAGQIGGYSLFPRPSRSLSFP